VHFLGDSAINDRSVEVNVFLFEIEPRFSNLSKEGFLVPKRWIVGVQDLVKIITRQDLMFQYPKVG
jgi:hypothetical protein